MGILAMLLWCLGSACAEGVGTCEDPFAVAPGCDTCVSGTYFYDPVDGRCEISVQDLDVEETLNETLFMGAPRTELIDQYLDSAQIVDYVSSWSLPGKLVFNKMCTEFQLGWTNYNLTELSLLAEFMSQLKVSAEASNSYVEVNSLPTVIILVSLVQSKADFGLHYLLLKGYEDQLNEILAVGDNVDEVREVALRYATLANFFGLARDEEVVQKVRQALFPDGEYVLPEQLSLEAVKNLYLVRPFGVDVDVQDVTELLRRSWHEGGYPEVTDCDDPECSAKIVSLVGLLDIPLPGIDSDLLADLAALVINGMEADGGFGYVRIWGGEPTLMVSGEACDPFCQASTWHIVAMLNHVLGVLEDRGELQLLDDRLDDPNSPE